MVASFLIFLREGIEASMIVAILLAYLNKSGQRRYFRYVISGVAAALVVATAAGIVIYLSVQNYAGTHLQTVIETVTYLLATVVMTYMTFWMRSHGKSISQELRGRTDAVLEKGAGVSMALMAFQAVGRESLEAMVFTLAIVFSSGVGGASLGASLGTITSLAIAYAMYRLGHRLNIAKAFKVLGIALMFFAAGLLVDAVQNLQQLRWIRFMNHAMWNSTSLLNDQSNLGDVAHSFFGYASQPTSLQLVSYLLYLGATIGIFLILGKRGQATRSGTKATHRP